MYGSAPRVVGNFNIDCPEMMFYMYLPIKLPHTGYRIPERLKPFQPLIDEIVVLVSKILSVLLKVITFLIKWSPIGMLKRIWDAINKGNKKDNPLLPAERLLVDISREKDVQDKLFKYDPNIRIR